jgi:hypothetical protein
MTDPGIRDDTSKKREEADSLAALGMTNRKAKASAKARATM